MKRCLCRITVVVLCLALSLGPTASAQRPDHGVTQLLGVVPPGGMVTYGAPGPSGQLLLEVEVIAEGTDPQGDMDPPLLWMPWNRPDRDVFVGPQQFRLDLPSFMLHSPEQSFSWTVDARALTDGTLHDTLDELGTWHPGGTSVVSDPLDAAVLDYADLTLASVQALDPQHVRFEAQVRGNSPAAWDSEMYIFSLFPFSTQEWDTWLYLMPQFDQQQAWTSWVAYDMAVAPAQALPYLDILSSRISRESGEIVLETTVAGMVPQNPDLEPVRPMFAWWFNLAPDGGSHSGGGVPVNDRFMVILLVFVATLWAARAFVWGNPEWVQIAELEHEISADTVRVRVPATVLPLGSRRVWSPQTGMFLGDDPEAYYTVVDYMEGRDVGPLVYRIFLPIIRRNS